MPLTTTTYTLQPRTLPASARLEDACPSCNSLITDNYCQIAGCQRYGLTSRFLHEAVVTPTRTPSAARTTTRVTRPSPRDFPQRRTWSEARRFDNDTSFAQTKSTRRFGVEIETSDCPNHRRLRNLSSFNCVEDGSVDGLEFVSVPMKGDNGLNEVIQLCEFARDNNWKINSACGLHVHLDATDLSNEQMFKVAWAYLLTYDLWSSFLPVSRKNNYYCAKHFYNPSTLDMYTDFKTWVDLEVRGERYCWINFGAYLRHGTVELRNHTASLNRNKINNWIRAHIRFIDKVSEMSMTEIMDKFNGTTQAEQFEHVAATWETQYLREYYLRRAHQFNYLGDVS